MSHVYPSPLLDSTSAEGTLHQVSRPLIVGVMLLSWGTSAAYSRGGFSQETLREFSGRLTSTGEAASLAVPAGEAIAELRSLSGLTWDQLARLLGVSRRSLHLWASGKPMAATNQEKLARVLAILKQLDRGTAVANRTWLLAPSAEGQLPFDLLKVGAYGQVVALWPRSDLLVAQRSTSVPVSQGRPDTETSSPDELVGALQDKIHRDAGPVRAARGVKSRGGS